MLVSSKMAEASRRSSWIRKMFEEGLRLSEIHGRDAVADFSLGNPNLDPPRELQEALQDLVCNDTPGFHGYMSNAGYESTRAAVAGYLSEDQGVHLEGANVVMTCGAGGGLNVVFKAVLDAGDEVVVASPYFMEYLSYVDNHGGVLKPVKTLADFDLDLQAMEHAIGPRTRAVLLNSPNNPTGSVYPETTVAALGELLRRKCAETGRLIYLVSDEPYRRIVYDGVRVAPVMADYENSIIVSSYSRNSLWPGRG